ncbi:MAG: hypothetical protein AB1757_16810 [Acidobacteriota bacterium]
MINKQLQALTLIFGLFICLTLTAQAQESATEDEKAAPEKKAVALLEQVVVESSSLRLPENRIRLQIQLGDLLWMRNEGQARAMFDAAGAALQELQRVASANRVNNRRGFDPGFNMVMQLRQELVMTAAQHNATLAYQLLSLTRLPATSDSPFNRQQANLESNMEQTLMAQIARIDPQMALKNAEEWLDKGQYPYSLTQVIYDLQSKDKDAAARLTERVVKQLQAENLLAKPEAARMVSMLLMSGPRPVENANAENSAARVQIVQYSSQPVLDEATYRSLLEQLITAALKDTSATQGGQRAGGQSRGFNTGQGASEQENARMLLMQLGSLMSQIEKYAPTRAAAVRQRTGQAGMDFNRGAEYREMMQKGTSENLVAAAASAPEYMQRQLYYQAASKAINEGNFDRARQIVNDHVDPAMRGELLKTIESKQMSAKEKELTMDSVRQALSRFNSDDERVGFLIDLSRQQQKNNPKLASQILEEAQKLIGIRLSSYDQLEDQLAIARAYIELDTGRSFEALDPGINQLNQLFPAASQLSGFEVNIFKDGEMLLIQGGNRLASMVNQYAEQIAQLAQKDFDRALTTADKFQISEARLMARLTIARQVLGGRSQNNFNRFGGRGGISIGGGRPGRP